MSEICHTYIVFNFLINLKITIMIIVNSLNIEGNTIEYMQI